MPELNREIQKLEKVTRSMSGKASLNTRDQVDVLRKEVQEGHRANMRFEDYTKVRRRESLLLSLYLMDLASEQSRSLLPEFDEEVAASILGDSSKILKRHLRRQATLLYFTHYGRERIKALDCLADRLKASWKNESEDRLFDPASRAYRSSADFLFCSDAPSMIAKEWSSGESVEALSNRFGIPPGGEFNERLLEEVILERLRKTSEEGVDEGLDDLVVDSKERLMSSGYPLGAEAVRILITRAISEFNGDVPSGWKEHLVSYACDPRVPSSSELVKWWGWASQKEKDVAIRALTELTLRQFISLLKASLGGTAAGEPFKKRAKMLLRIFELGKVIDARLVVHESTYRMLPTRTRQTLRPLQTSGGPQYTSFVCLRCIDNVWLIEGTHSFALRGFVGASGFPVPSVWSANTGKYFHDSSFRISEHSCDFFQRHHTGDWLWDFNYQLRRRNIEWRGL